MATVFDLVAAKEKCEFEGIVRKFFGVGPGDEELFDPGGGKGGLFSKNAGVDGNYAPAKGYQSPLGDDFLRNFPDVGLSVGVFGGKKEEANSKISLLVQAVTKFLDLPFKKLEGDLGKDARPVPGFGIGIQSAAMGQLANAAKRAFQNRAGTFALNVGHKSDAARIVFVIRAVESLGTGKIVVETEPCHGSFTILKEPHGARVGILLRDKRFRGIVIHGPYPSLRG